MFHVQLVKLVGYISISSNYNNTQFVGYYFRYCNSQGVWDNTIINTCKSKSLQNDEDLVYMTFHVIWMPAF